MANTEDLSANLRKVQEILLGDHKREGDRRFSQLEERLSKETQRLRTDLIRRLELLEQFAKKEVDTLSGKLRDGEAQGSAAIKEFGRQLSVAQKAFDKKLAESDDRHGKAAGSLRKELQQQDEGVREQLAELGEELSSELEELRTDKLDRAALADLLTDIAGKLRGKKAPR